MQQKFFIQPFAFAGDKTAIPDALDPSGHVSFNQGYGFDYQRDLTSDPAAKAIERNGMNWLFGAITENLAQYQTSSAPEFITSTDNGGSAYSYARGVSVRYRTGTNPFLTYVSRIAGNTNTPTEGASDANWALLTFEISSSAQATAGTDDATIMTPLKVKQAITASASTVPAASETVAGIAKIATAAMVATGTDDTSMVTSLKLAQAVPVASTTVVGKSRFATPAETIAGALSTVAVTPAGLGSTLTSYALLSGAAFTGGVSAPRFTATSNLFVGGTDVAIAAGAVNRTVYLWPNGDSTRQTTIDGATGNMSVFGRVTCLEVSATNGNIFTTAGQLSLGASTTIALRPNGVTSSTGQTVIASSGGMTVAGSVTAAGSFVANGGSLVAWLGATGTQQVLTSLGYSNQVRRWAHVIEPNGSLSHYSYDTSGGTPTNLFNIASVVAGGANAISTAGSMTAASFQVSSSRKIKEITGTIDSALRTVCEIETGRGHYLPSFTEDQRERLFLIAEQLRPLVPEAVIDRHDADENARLGPTVEYTALIPVLIEAIKELARTH